MSSFLKIRRCTLRARICKSNYFNNCLGCLLQPLMITKGERKVQQQPLFKFKCHCLGGICATNKEGANIYLTRYNCLKTGLSSTTSQVPIPPITTTIRQVFIPEMVFPTSLCRREPSHLQEFKTSIIPEAPSPVRSMETIS